MTTFSSSIRKAFLAILPDKSDAVLFSGLGSLFYGLYTKFDPSTAFIGLGVVLMVIAVIPFFVSDKTGAQ